MFVAQITLPTPLTVLLRTSMLSGVCRMWLQVWWDNWVGVSSVFAPGSRGNHQELWKVIRESWFAVSQHEL